MVSKKHQFIFSHYPKTGGNSIQTLLAPYSEDELVPFETDSHGVRQRFEVQHETGEKLLDKHATMRDYERYLSAEFFEKAFKFSVLRNPWEGMISFYFSAHRQLPTDHVFEKNLFLTLLERRPSFVDFNGLENGELGLNEVVAFEELEKVTSLLSERLQLPLAPLPKVNVSRYRDWRSYYDDDLYERVREKFGPDIALGGYSL